jgi:hypothetical protein
MNTYAACERAVARDTSMRLAQANGAERRNATRNGGLTSRELTPPNTARLLH